MIRSQTNAPSGAIGSKSLCQPINLAKPTFLWAWALSIILMQAQTLAFMAPSLSTLQLARVDQSPSIRNMHTPLAMVTKSGGRAIASTDQFEDEVLTNSPKNKLILVLFTASWCGPCRLTNPVVKEVMKQYQSKLEVVDINTDDLPEVASNAGVTSIPTIQVYYGGKVKDTIVGCVSKNVLARAVDKVLEDLGMLGSDEEDEGKFDTSEGESS